MTSAPNYKTLFDAVERNDVAAVKRNIQEGLAASTTNTKGETAAHLAARKGNLPLVEFLLSQDKSLLSAKDQSGQNILYVAAAKGNLDVVKYLVDNCGVDVLHADNIRLGNSVVHVAAREGHLDMLKYFIEEKHIDANLLNGQGEPIAFLAAGNKKLPIIIYLVETHNADLTIIDRDNRNILFPAAMKGDVTVPTYVLDQKKVNLDINWTDRQGRTVLHWSALSNYLKVTEYFVEAKKANVNIADFKKQTPLHLAAAAGHVKLVEFLYETGADPQLADVDGKTPQQLAKGRKVAQFFEDYPKKRNRRSASEWYVFANPSVPYPWVRRIAANVFWSSRLVDGLTCFGNGNVAPIGSFDNFLTLASAYLGGHRAPFLPAAQTVNDRVDPIALNFVERFYRRN